ncbi:hypothetical protein PFISCL1PPCAC_26350, partial [Pristionchus fissidentatus]
ARQSPSTCVMSGVDSITSQVKSLDLIGSERNRPLRTQHTPDDLNYVDIKPAQRPSVKHGTRGEQIDLLVNWYQLNLQLTKTQTIYIYELKMEEERREQGVKKYVEIKNYTTIAQIFWDMVRSKKNREIFSHPFSLVFDDKKRMFTPCRLNVPGDPLWKGKVRVLMEISSMFDINPDKTTTDEEACARYLNHLLSQKSRWIPPKNADRREIEFSKRFVQVGGGMYLIPRTDDIPTIPVQKGVQFWVGLYATVRRMEDESPVFLFGLSNKLFVELNLKLTDFYAGINDFHPVDRRSCLSDKAANDFDHKLGGVKLKCAKCPVIDKDGLVVACKDRHFKLVGISKGEFPSNYEMRVEDKGLQERDLTVTKNDGSRIT